MNASQANAQDYDDATCAQKLTAEGMTPVCTQIPGLPHHCQDFIGKALHDDCVRAGDVYRPTYIAACVRNLGTPQEEWYYSTPDTILSRCNDLHLQDPAWQLGQCYCCCACFAYGTLVAVPGGTKVIQDIRRGDMVLAGALRDGRPVWEPASVTFSEGAGGKGAPVVSCYLRLRKGDESLEIVCTPDQVFMLHGRRLVQASRLRVGELLMDGEGNPVEVVVTAIGTYDGGLHHVATERPGHAGVDGHLLLAGGVVAGDYFLQVNFDALPDEVKAVDLDARPEIGSPEYERLHGGERRSAKIAFGAVKDPRAGRLRTQQGVFTMFSAGDSGEYEAAAKFLTPEQAEDIARNATQNPLSNTIPKAFFEWITRALAGSYPDVTFYLDWFRAEPNVYAFRQYGKKFVVVTGGLARTSGFQLEGLAMAIGHGIGRLADEPPLGHDGDSGTGVADWYAFGLVSRALFSPRHGVQDVGAAYAQMSALFGYIDPAHAKGNPHDPVNHPSIACRLSAMSAGAAGGDIPSCCGGPVQRLISLDGLTGTPQGFTLTLSVTPTEKSALDPAHYVIDPAVPIEKVRVDPAGGFILHLDAAPKPGSYRVTIRDLESILGTGVDPEHATRSCEVKAPKP